MNISQDFRDYSGKDRYWAIYYDSLGIGISTFVGTLSLSSGIASVGVSAIANRSIDALVLKYKLKNTKTDKEKEYMEKLNRFQKAGN